MRERTFVVRRQGGWERLEALLAAVDRKGIASLRPPELEELALLYRSMTTDLAAAQTRGYGTELAAYLNRTTSRAYAVVHRGSARAGWKNVADFYVRTYPREVRASWRIIAVTSVLFVIATVASYWLVAAKPSNAYAILPAQAVPAITKRLHDSNFGFDRTLAPEMSSRIITNNVKVAMLAFAGGIATLGIGTAWAIFSNGLDLGATGALFAQKGFGSDFWATIAPHGVIELTSIQIAGAAGFKFTQAIIAPGRLRRSDALRNAGRAAGILMIGVASQLVVAGTIEGFVSPQRLPEALRIAIGALTAVVLFGYLALAGRTAPGETLTADRAP